MNSISQHFRIFPRILSSNVRRLAFIAVVLCTSTVYGQAEWDITPYKIHVWIAMESSAELTPKLLKDTAQALMRRSESLAGNIWNVSATGAPTFLVPSIVADITSLSADQIKVVDEKALDFDKLVLINISTEADGFRIEARELDCLTRNWGPRDMQRTQQLHRIPNEAFTTFSNVFRPVVLLESTFEKKEGGKKVKYARARLRAGSLIISKDSRALPKTGSVLLPIMRRNDRTGKLRPGGIQPILWTLLTVENRFENVLECRIHTGLRNAIRRRSSRVSQQLAIAVKPHLASTQLIVQTNEKEPNRLEGYEIFSRTPTPLGSAKTSGNDASEFLGWTSWKGDIEVPRSNGPLRILYVKSGGQILARLPMLPGLEASQTVTITDDVRRLKAEGVVRGLQSEIVDLAVRRQLIALEVMQIMKQGKFDLAQKKIDELFQFRTVIELDNMLSLRQTENSAAHPRSKEKVNEMFNIIRQQLNTHRRQFDRSMVEDLTKKLEQARGNSP